MPKITLAMPVYNVEEYVERALLSALNQTYDDYEVLVIDDKGADNSMDVVRKVQKEHPRGGLIRIVEHAQNRGTGATRNTAIDEAQGEYLMYMDSDDEITPDCLEIHYRAIKETDADSTVGGINNVDIDGDISKYIYNPKSYLILKNRDEVEKYYWNSDNPRYVYTWNKLYKLSFLRDNNIRCVEHHLGEDTLFTFQVVINTTKVVFLPNETYLYYERAGSWVDRIKSGSNIKQVTLEVYDIVKYIQSTLTDEDSSLNKNIINYMYASHIDINIRIKIENLPVDDDLRDTILKTYNLLSRGNLYNKLRAYFITYHSYTLFRIVDLLLAPLSARRLKSLSKKIFKQK